MSDVCPYCVDGPDWANLNELAVNEWESDIQVRVRHNGFLSCKHYDVEGNTYDDRVDIPINFCPVCGRALKK